MCEGCNEILPYLEIHNDNLPHNVINFGSSYADTCPLNNVGKVSCYSFAIAPVRYCGKLQYPLLIHVRGRIPISPVTC